MNLYFAYGSNLSKQAMRRRAEASRPLIAAILPGHRLTFESNEPPGSKAAFFANIRPDAGCSVPGALYELDTGALEALDAYEDVQRGVYERAILRVLRADGRLEGAIVYRMHPMSRRALKRGMPSAHQLAQIRRGYADWGLDVRVLAAALASASSKIS